MPQYEDSIVKRYIGEAAANYLYDTVKDGDIIATTWGTTLFQMASQLKDKRFATLRSYSSTAGLAIRKRIHTLMKLFIYSARLFIRYLTLFRCGAC